MPPAADSSRPRRWMNASRGGLVGTRRAPRPISSQSAMPSGFCVEQRVRAAVDRVAVDLFAQDHAAGARRALEHDERRPRRDSS